MRTTPACFSVGRISRPRRLFISLAVAGLAVGSSGCSLLFGSAEDGDAAAAAPNSLDESSAWLADGLIAIARPLPASSTALALAGAPVEMAAETAAAPVELDSATMLGFMPLPPGQAALWLSIDSKNETLALMRGSTVVSSAPAQGAASLQSGTYEVMHKQTAPLWHAPARYFEDRGLPVPPEGDRARFRRGALGDKALFLDANTPIHTGPVWSSEVGGLKLDDTAMEALYNQLEVGSKVVVR